MAESALATLNGLMKATQAEVELPEPTQVLLSRKTVIIGRIPHSTFRALFPFLPAAVVVPGPDEADLTDAERLVRQREREMRWMETADSAERVKYRVDVEQVKFRALALALVEPKMTEAEVTRLGDEIMPVYVRLLEISGIITPAAPAVEAPAG